MVFVQADARRDQGLQEAQWVHELAQRWPQIIGVVAFAPVEDGPSVRSYLRSLSDLPLVVGVRRLLQSEELSFFDQSSFHEGLEALQATGLRFDACVRHHQLPALITVATRHAQLPIVLDHLGKPPVMEGITSESGREWVGNIRRLAALPNVFVKLSRSPRGGDGRDVSELEFRALADGGAGCFRLRAVDARQ